MKSIKDIENISLEQLEAVSMDESITVPDGFAARMKENADAAVTAGLLTGNESEGQGRRKAVRYVAAAASVAIMAGVGYGIAQWQNQPKDTFDDPYLAYAEVEKAFAKISSSINRSLAMAGETEQVIEKATSVFSEK
jgi:hypothetical protein